MGTGRHGRHERERGIKRYQYRAKPRKWIDKSSGGGGWWVVDDGAVCALPVQKLGHVAWGFRGDYTSIG